MQVILWVVYQILAPGKPEGTRAVCEQSEWEAMDRAKPGRYQLVQGGIVNEGEAERLARGASGDPVPRRGRVAPVAATGTASGPATGGEVP